LDRKWKSPFGSVSLLHTTRPRLQWSKLKCLGIMIVPKNDTSPSFRCNRWKKLVGHGQWVSLLGYGPIMIKCMNYLANWHVKPPVSTLWFERQARKWWWTRVGSPIRNSIGILQVTYEIITVTRVPNYLIYLRLLGSILWRKQQRNNPQIMTRGDFVLLIIIHINNDKHATIEARKWYTRKCVYVYKILSCKLQTIPNRVVWLYIVLSTGKNRMWTYICICIHSSGHSSDPSKQLSVEQRKIWSLFQHPKPTIILSTPTFQQMRNKPRQWNHRSKILIHNTTIISSLAPSITRRSENIILI